MEVTGIPGTKELVQEARGQGIWDRGIGQGTWDRGMGCRHKKT